ncbi:unnamed protein product, partial [Staurois parvus]
MSCQSPPVPQVRVLSVNLRTLRSKIECANDDRAIEHEKG